MIIAFVAMPPWLERLDSAPEGDGNVLQHSRGTLIFFLLMVVGAPAYVAAFGWPGRSDWKASVVIVAAFLAGLYVVAECIRVRHRLEPGGLRYQTMSGKRGLLLWADVTRVEYLGTGKVLRLSTSGGPVVDVSVWLTCVAEFARVVLEQVPQTSIERPARSVLELLASGRRVPVFG